MSEISLKPDDLPSTWVLTNLGSVVDYGSTTKAEPSQISDDDWVLELEDIEKDSSRLLHRITFAKRQSKSTKNRFHAGDVLYGKLRPYLNKVLIADHDGYCTTEIVPIKTGAQLDSRYLFYWLKHPAFLKYVEAESHGMNMPRLGTDTAKAAPFVLAPRNEQTRIADQLDQLLARVQACNDRLDAIPALLKRFRQAVLSAAVKGKLIERETGGSATEWRRCTVGDVLQGKPRNGYSPRSVDFKTPVRSLTLSATTSGRFLAQHSKFIDEHIPEDSYLWLETGDILIQRANTLDYVGVSAIFDGPEKEFIYPDLIMKCRPNELVLRKYLFYMLSAEETRQYFRDHATGTAGNMPKINQQTVMSAPIVLPSLEEQEEIVREIDKLFSLADSIEARYTAARTQAHRLAPRLLAKAFRGELVPQDPQDEPASVLLERIAVANVAKARTSRGRPRLQPERQLPLPELDSIEWASLPDGAWAAPADPDGHATMVWVTAVLRAWGEPVPEREARLAAMLCQQPRLFATVLPAAEATLWSRLVGDEARPLPTQVLSFQPAINSHWGRTIKGMRARDDLVEAGLGDGITWALGAGAACIETAGWPDGRARFVVAHLRAHGTDSVLPLLESSAQEFVDAKAA
jgi:type I restriction enzyme S subunit